ncbi:MAG: hypothetical protein AAF438_06995 [Pseudomonadota bacterium]
MALPEEAKTLGLKHAKPLSLHKLNATVTVAVCGAGSENAARASRELLSAGSRHLMSFGTAAGLKEEADVGCLVIPNHVLMEDVDLPVDVAWRKEIIRRIDERHNSGKLLALTSISQTRQKQELGKQVNCLAGDMESGAVAAYCRENNLPFSVIRVVVDDVNTAIPSVVTDALDENGMVSLGKLFSGLLLKPWQIIALVSLARKFARAKRVLSSVAMRLAPDFAVVDRLS